MTIGKSAATAGVLLPCSDRRRYARPRQHEIGGAGEQYEIMGAFRGDAFHGLTVVRSAAVERPRQVYGVGCVIALDDRGSKPKPLADLLAGIVIGVPDPASFKCLNTRLRCGNSTPGKDLLNIDNAAFLHADQSTHGEGPSADNIWPETDNA